MNKRNDTRPQVAQEFIERFSQKITTEKYEELQDLRKSAATVNLTEEELKGAISCMVSTVTLIAHRPYVETFVEDTSALMLVLSERLVEASKNPTQSRPLRQVKFVEADEQQRRITFLSDPSVCRSLGFTELGVLAASGIVSGQMYLGVYPWFDFGDVVDYIKGLSPKEDETDD